jgi:hypothetical protein
MKSYRKEELERFVQCPKCRGEKYVKAYIPSQMEPNVIVETLQKCDFCDGLGVVEVIGEKDND